MWCSPPCLVNTLLSGSVLVYTPRCTALRAQLYLCGSAPLRGSLYTCRSAQCATKHAAPHVSARLSALHISALLCAPHCNKTPRRQRSLCAPNTVLTTRYPPGSAVCATARDLHAALRHSVHDLHAAFHGFAHISAHRCYSTWPSCSVSLSASPCVPLSLSRCASDTPDGHFAAVRSMAMT